jgi:hypothetical protein
MWGGLSDPRPLAIGSVRGHIALPTNISFVESAHVIAAALAEVARQTTVSVKEIPTLKDLHESHPPADLPQGVEWDAVGARQALPNH